MKKLAIVVPVFNEQYNIIPFIEACKQALHSLTIQYSIYFIDDGSTDQSLDIIKQQSKESNLINFISFSRNFGHQNALKAGIDHIEADAFICMDGDLQHPPELIPAMLELWNEGYEVVYTIRQDQKELTLSKRKTSLLFYKFLNKLSDIELESGTADFRLIDKKVVLELRKINETDLFYRGLIKWVGFKQKSITYIPGKRVSGNTKYTFKKMVSFALKGITSFSTKPLYFATYFGLIFSLLSLLYIPYILYSYFFGKVVSGWTSVIATITFFGGLQLMMLGVIGIYLGKLFMQNKQRPHYIIKEENFKEVE